MAEDSLGILEQDILACIDSTLLPQNLKADLKTQFSKLFRPLARLRRQRDGKRPILTELYQKLQAEELSKLCRKIILAAQDTASLNVAQSGAVSQYGPIRSGLLEFFLALEIDINLNNNEYEDESTIALS
jgi:hypothetical protein